MSRTETHYSADMGGDIKAFINHFKKQAEGSERPFIISNRPCFTSVRNCRTSSPGLVLIDTRKVEEKEKGHSEVRVEMIDPSEGARRRAMGEIVRQETEMSNMTDDYNKTHSPLNKRKRKSKQIQQAVDKKIKRARDIFD